MYTYSGAVGLPTPFYRDSCEPMELQLDYWLISSKIGDVKSDTGASGRKGDSGKLSLKSVFRSLLVSKLSFGEIPAAQFSINYTIKEKKQKSWYFFVLAVFR